MARVDHPFTPSLATWSVKTDSMTVPPIPSLGDALEFLSRVLRDTPNDLHHYSELILLPVRLHLFNACTGGNADTEMLGDCLNLLQKLLPNIRRLRKFTTFDEISTALTRLLTMPANENERCERIAILKAVIFACPEPHLLLTEANYLKTGYFISTMMQAVSKDAELMKQPAILDDVCTTLAFIINSAQTDQTLLNAERQRVARLFLPGLTVFFNRVAFFSKSGHAANISMPPSDEIDLGMLQKALQFWVPLLKLAFFEFQSTPNDSRSSCDAEKWDKDQAVKIVSQIIVQCHRGLARYYQRTKNITALYTALPLDVLIINPKNAVPSLLTPNSALICDYVFQALDTLRANSRTRRKVADDDKFWQSEAEQNLLLACKCEKEIYHTSGVVHFLKELFFNNLRFLTNLDNALVKDIESAIRSVDICVDILRLSGRFTCVLDVTSSLPSKLDAVFDAFVSLLALDCSKLNFIDNCDAIITIGESETLSKLLPVIKYAKHAETHADAIRLLDKVCEAVLFNEKSSSDETSVMLFNHFLDYLTSKRQQRVHILFIMRAALELILKQTQNLSCNTTLVDFFIDSVLPALYGSAWWNVSTSLHSYNVARVAQAVDLQRKNNDHIALIGANNNLCADAVESTPSNIKQLRECVMMQLLALDISALVFSIAAPKSESPPFADDETEENHLHRLVPVCLAQVIEKLHDDELLVICSHAQQTLMNIGIACGYSSLSTLLCRFMPVLTNIYALRMRHLELYPKSVSALKSIVSLGGDQIFFGSVDDDGSASYVWPLVDYCLDTLDRHFEHASSPATIPLVDVLVAVMRQMEKTFTSVEYSKKFDSNSNKLPFFMTMVERIARRFAFLLPTTQPNNKKNSSRVQMQLYAQLAAGLTSAFRTLSIEFSSIGETKSKIDDILLPLVYQTWSPLVNGLHQSHVSQNIHAFRMSFQLLVSVTRAARDFVSARLMKQCFPDLIELLQEQSSALRIAACNNNFTYYANSVQHKLECEMLAEFPQLLEHVTCDLQACQKLQSICQTFKETRDFEGASNFSSIKNLELSVKILSSFAERKAAEWNEIDAKMSVTANLRAEPGYEE